MANKPLFMHLSVAKESREVPIQEIDRTPITAHIKETFGNNLNYFMKVSLLFSIFALPLLVLCGWALNYMLVLKAAEYNFTGNLGIGFPGITSDPIAGYLAQLDVYIFFFELIIPAFTILGLGVAGAMNCTKKAIWKEDGDFLKIFFRGIKKYWYKCMLATTIMGTMVFTCGWVTIWLMKLNMTGKILPWHWVVTVFTYILFVPILFATYQMAPLSVTYDSMKLMEIIKNSFILAFENILPSFIFTILIAIPVLIISFLSIEISMIFYILFIMLGFAFYVMAGNLLGIYGFNIYLNPLYFAMAKSELKPKKEKKKKEKVFKSKKAKTVEAKAPKEKKPKKQNNYVNPKKKKKNDNK